MPRLSPWNTSLGVLACEGSENKLSSSWSFSVDSQQFSAARASCQKLAVALNCFWALSYWISDTFPWVFAPCQSKRCCYSTCAISHRWAQSKLFKVGSNCQECSISISNLHAIHKFLCRIAFALVSSTLPTRFSEAGQRDSQARVRNSSDRKDSWCLRYSVAG